MTIVRTDNLRRGPWYEEEDERLKAFVAVLGERRWDSLAKESGLRRSGKSCRLRWLNYLRPCLKHGPLSPEEERLILKLHEKWGNKWATIARRLPGRTDNEIKNYWRTHLRKKIQMQNDQLQFYSNSEVSSVSSIQTSFSYDQTNNLIQYRDDSFEKSNIITQEKSEDNDEEVSTIGELGGNTIPCYNHHSKGLPNDTIASSPYENQLSDWITTLSAEHSDKSSAPSSWESNGSEFYFDYLLTWGLEDGAAWDSSGPLWDVDLFNVNS